MITTQASTSTAHEKAGHAVGRHALGGASSYSVTIETDRRSTRVRSSVRPFRVRHLTPGCGRVAPAPSRPMGFPSTAEDGDG